MSKDTLVLQSYRPHGVPDWIGECLASVRGWASGRGFDHLLLGDELFDLLPPGIAALGEPPALPATDLARLLWCRRLLDEGRARVIWLDADIFVADPDAFVFDETASYLLCREFWVWREGGEVRGRRAVNNCAMAFTRHASFLNRYISLCEEAARTATGPLHRLALGPTLLTRIGRETPLPQIGTVATLSPLLIDAIRRDDKALLALFLDQWRAPVHAVHLCRSLGGEGNGPRLNENGAEADVLALLRTAPELLRRPDPAP